MLKDQTREEVFKARKYITTRSNNLPFGPCYMSEDWWDSHDLVSVFVTRKMPSDQYVLCMYLIDKGCLGIKSTIYGMNYTYEELLEFIGEISTGEGREFEEVSPEDCHNVIFGAVDYAEELGFQPMDKDWKVSMHFLDEAMITDDIDKINFGKDGKPYYHQGPYDNVKKILATLRKNVGEGNFDFVMVTDDF